MSVLCYWKTVPSVFPLLSALSTQNGSKNLYVTGSLEGSSKSVESLCCPQYNGKHGIFVSWKHIMPKWHSFSVTVKTYKLNLKT